MKRAFTIIELIVVIGIMVLMLGIAIPAVKSMTRGNSRSQANNLVRAYLANARAKALSQHRMVGIVFFDGPNQTNMQIIAEDMNQAKYVLADNTHTPNRVFVYENKSRESLPMGMQVAVLNDDPVQAITTGGGSGTKGRVVLFDSNGQLVLRSGVARPSTAAIGSYSPITDTPYPQAYLDWNLPSHETVNSGNAPTSLGVSSPAIVIFSAKDYADKGFTSSSADQASAATWIKANSDVLVINIYTGGIIR